jgi:hypothetical protein
MKKVLLLVMCVFGFQSASYGFLGTALNTESEKAFLKSLETQSGMTDEQATALLLKASRLQSQLHKWSAAGAGISAPFLVLSAYAVWVNVIKIQDRTFTWGLLATVLLVVTGGLGLIFGKSLASSIRAKKRASRYKKMAQHAAHLKYYQRFTERCGYMADYYGKSAWNTIAQGRKKVMKKGLNAQLIGTSAGALGAVIAAISAIALLYSNSLSILSPKMGLAAIAFVAFTLFSAYGLKGIVRKQAMKKFMDQMNNEFSGARLIAHDPEAAALAQIAEWEREEAAAHAQPVA